MFSGREFELIFVFGCCCSCCRCTDTLTKALTRAPTRASARALTRAFSRALTRALISKRIKKAQSQRTSLSVHTPSRVSFHHQHAHIEFFDVQANIRSKRNQRRGQAKFTRGNHLRCQVLPPAHSPTHSAHTAAFDTRDSYASDAQGTPVHAYTNNLCVTTHTQRLNANRMKSRRWFCRQRTTTTTTKSLVA